MAYGRENGVHPVLPGLSPAEQTKDVRISSRRRQKEVKT
jgi:hypothetical protein